MMQVLARRALRQAAALVMSMVCLCVALACGSSSGPGGTGVQVLRVGNEALVIVHAGSLASTSPTNDAERVAALAQYLKDNLGLFGPGVDPAGVTFDQAAPQQPMRGATGDTHILLALRQTHMGAPVIDEMLMGAFHQGVGGDQLRRVRGFVRDPSLLAVPPDPIVHPPARVAPVVTTLITDLGLSADATQVSDMPVISAAHGIAGYLVKQFVSTPSGAFHDFQAIVDPRDLRVVVITNQPPCDSTLAFPGGVAFAPTTPPFFELPGDLFPLRSVRIHAVQLSDFGGGRQAPITRGQVKLWVDAANTVWFPQAGLFFGFDNSAGSADFETLESTLLNTVPPEGDDATAATYKAAANIWSLLFHHKKVVVFFREGGGPGWSWGPTSTFFVSMPSWTQTGINKPDDGGVVANETLLSHELGHYFGLAHTFSGAKCVDAVPANSNGDVNGQDGNTLDDDVLDTLPDMRDACFPTDSLTCTGGIVLYNDQLWNPPWSNVMSYHDCLPETLSVDQIAAINRTLQHPVRAELLK